MCEHLGISARIGKKVKGNNNSAINDTYKEKLCFNKFSTRMAAWQLLSFFICLHNQLSSTHSIIMY